MPHPISLAKYLAFVLAISCFSLTVDAQRRNVSGQGQLLDIDFPGGTLAEYVGAVRTAVKQQHDSELNVLITNDQVSKERVPPVKFSSITAESALKILSRAVSGNTRIKVDREGAIHYISGYTYSTMAGLSGGSGGPAMGGMMAASRARPSKPKVMTTVQSVKNILKYKSQEDLLSAIEIGIKMLGRKDGEDDITLQLHKETGLLFVKGTSTQIAMVDSIVRELDVDPKEAKSELETQEMREMIRKMQESRGGGIRDGGRRGGSSGGGIRDGSGRSGSSGGGNSGR